MSIAGNPKAHSGGLSEKAKVRPKKNKPRGSLECGAFFSKKLNKKAWYQGFVETRVFFVFHLDFCGCTDR
ncbi:MAG: hypothetical protein A2836_03555 [Candidatus Taylorbacteria bacterium RIFCSPHIGHO2_01_FULL_45_63]|uniref:Uncharacterized protein n=1 Tax=Candidatus Taylorbacteria bacterium RIFCSPHIGHO2_02_FULL_45_35 TaxID=1802311 RepID=A0A1G2MSU6_9BACT|nr:MAG: hypothetical protein A2836_03555 [Candidatus Taylorbacteria bacterium RIFCSPHIGHO2_01_FULL_45_63]OHA26041.1 MAG: hypothetical protein A3D56_02895 [Candidatus Taylorbacteria bacterium RIFCSPHIGHO2_02_FULL_45_35]OHA32470.1 MAG: hypothetical protein A3A22_01560 [Candidatus Taylorbacteria bacterium RIFCSPLOWO2_01_FULL_45_34b]